MTGIERLVYELIFDASYTAIAGGQIMAYDADGGLVTVSQFGVDLVYDVLTRFSDNESGYFLVSAGNLDDEAVSEKGQIDSVTAFSRSVMSVGAVSQIDVTITESNNSSVLSVSHSAALDVGGGESCVSFIVSFHVVPKVFYEVVGNMSGSFSGVPEQDVQLYTSVGFEGFNQALFFFEQDNAINTSPVDFTINGVQEGNIGGEVPSEGSRTGVLQVGELSQVGGKSFHGSSCAFSRGGGFSAEAESRRGLRRGTRWLRLRLQ